MVEGTSYMFVTGPNVVKAVTHEDVDAEQLGGATTHTTRSGVAHLAAPDEAEALDLGARILGYLPQNNLETAPRPRRQRSDAIACDPRSTPIVPDDPAKPYDMHDVIDARRRRRRIPRDPAGLGANIIDRFRATGRPQRRHRRAAAGGLGRCARHRRVDQGGAVRPDVRRLQRSAGDLRRRARISARRQAGTRRNHPPRREAALSRIARRRCRSSRSSPARHTAAPTTS